MLGNPTSELEKLIVGLGSYSLIITVLIVLILTYFCFFTMWESDSIDRGLIINKVNIPGVIEFNKKIKNEEDIPLTYVYNPSKKLKPPVEHEISQPANNNQKSKIVTQLPPFTPNFLGELKIKIIRGDSIKSGKSIFGNSDVYAVLQIGNQKKETSVKKEGGQNPIWDEEVSFNITDRDDTLHITIFDKETVDQDRFMAQSSVSILDWITYKTFDGSLNLIDKRNKSEGQLLISSIFIPSDTTITANTDSANTTTENITKVGSWI